MQRKRHTSGFFYYKNYENDIFENALIKSTENYRVVSDFYSSAHATEAIRLIRFD